MRYALAWIAAGIAGIALIFALWFGGIIFSNKTANFRGNASVINKTRANGNYRIAAYDHFYDLCASVQNQEVTIEAQKAELATNPSKDRKEQINANLSALAANRGELINQYNADARKNYTSGQFKSSDLPFHLDSTEAQTTCTA